MTLRFDRLCLAACLVVLAAPRLPAQTPIPGANASAANPIIDYNIQGVDVDAVLQNLEDFTGRVVIRPQALTPYTYTLKARLRKSDLIIALESLLEANGVAVIPLGDKYLKVVPLQLARTEAPEFIEGSTLDLPPSDRVVTKLFKLQFLRVAEFFNPPMQQAMFSPNIAGNVVTIEKANAAFITDTLANVQRTERLILQVDRPAMAGLTPKFYTLKNGAKASDIVNRLRTILTGPLQTQIGASTTFTPDDRTNQVILIADPQQYVFFDELIDKLDVKSDPNTRNEVIYLKHADAQTVAPILQQLVQGQVANAQKASAAQSLRPGEVTFAGRQPQAGAGNLPGVLNGVVPGGTLAPAPAPTPEPVGGVGGPNPNNEFSTLAIITADERSNSIIVSGTVDDIRLIRDLIAKIDIVLAQVRIEVIIAEVTLTDTDQSGITALGLTVGTDNTRGTHITNFTGSVPGWDVTSGVVNPLALQTALNTATTGSKNLVKILQTPVITTTHAKQGEVNVGEKDPLITGTQSTPVSGATGTSGFSTNSTVSYQDISVDLKVTPLIGDDGNIAMTIDQVVDDIIGNVVINGNNQPIIGHREMTSFLNCKDGEMMVLGGLQRTQKSTQHTKLGLLFEIPILSQLLGGHTDELQRTELLIFLRPHVVPLEGSTAETKEAVKGMSNKDQVDAYLADPTKQPDKNDKAKNLLDRF